MPVLCNSSPISQKGEVAVLCPVASESLDIERVHFRRAILDLEQVAPLVDGGLLRTFTIDGESV